MKVIVTGGAGYIGSHTCVDLLINGHEVLVIDDLSNSSGKALNSIKLISNKDILFVQQDLRNHKVIEKLFKDFRPDAVMHFAGLKAITESIEDPLRYYDVNVNGTISILKAMRNSHCKKIVFSSSATVYGIPNNLPIDENHSFDPVNPYGQTKLFVEKLIQAHTSSVSNFKSVILRYFNPVGAHNSGLIGEEIGTNPNNLVPFICKVAKFEKSHLNVYGKDYDTKDGTGVRDYIHVQDLARAHVVVLESFNNFDDFTTFNVGTGNPYSVLELIKTFEKITGLKIPHRFVQRRQGDVAKCLAEVDKIFQMTGWQAKYSLKEMLESAWNWEENRANDKDFYK
jgi:UDP-glucose 4-epimerase